jgi:hypothetical protein
MSKLGWGSSLRETHLSWRKLANGAKIGVKQPTLSIRKRRPTRCNHVREKAVKREAPMDGRRAALERLSAPLGARAQ